MRISTMTTAVTAVQVNGSYAVTRRALTSSEWVAGTWQLRFDDGKMIITSETELDRNYAGWRELPEA